MIRRSARSKIGAPSKNEEESLLLLPHSDSLRSNNTAKKVYYPSNAVLLLFIIIAFFLMGWTILLGRRNIVSKQNLDASDLQRNTKEFIPKIRQHKAAKDNSIRR
mmetsp:Transcript_6794/g.9889  ORF Transcript_6794/g.9889 Transcript_6794/m.9889 type:complete len:105 (-) Transcript_6794:460-774(-)